MDSSRTQPLDFHSPRPLQQASAQGLGGLLDSHLLRRLALRLRRVGVYQGKFRSFLPALSQRLGPWQLRGGR